MTEDNSALHEHLHRIERKVGIIGDALWTGFAIVLGIVAAKWSFVAGLAWWAAVPIGLAVGAAFYWRLTTHFNKSN